MLIICKKYKVGGRRLMMMTTSRHQFSYFNLTLFIISLSN